MQKRLTSRRSFLKVALGGSTGPFIFPSRLRAAETKANDKIGLGFIGTGKQSGSLISGFLNHDDTHVVAVCDVDQTRRTHAQKKVREFYRSQGGADECAAYNDFRELLARKDIDAVCIATPDHWHALITVAAAKAGKDIYCEKPLVHSVEEAVAVIGGVRKNSRVLQCGSMQRSMQEFRVACELVRNGVIGKIERVDCQFGQPGIPCDLPEEPVEPGLDWDRWLGPAPLRAYHSTLSPRGVHDHFPHWRLYREYGGGYVTDWGAHHLDIAQWGLGMDESGPVEIIPPPEAQKARSGGQLVYANGVTVTHRGDGFGVHFFGTDGEVKVNRGKFELVVKSESKARFVRREDGTSLDGAVAKAEKEFLADAKVRLYKSPKGNHLTDFLHCVKSRQQPCTHAEIGARSATVCNLLNLGYYHGQKFKWNPASFAFADGTGDPKWLRDDYRGDWSLA
ncbi:MAG: Gfo/Idh/MocA family oxidoreductase [Verrucomicrobiales bacterium]